MKPLLYFLLYWFIALSEKVLAATITGDTTWSAGNQYFDSATLTCEECALPRLPSDNDMEWVCPATHQVGTDSRLPSCTQWNSTSAARLIQDEWLDCNPAGCACTNNEYLSEDSATAGEIDWVSWPKGYFSNFTTTSVYNWTIWPLEGQETTGTDYCSCPTGTEEQSTICVDSTDFATVVTDSFSLATGLTISYTGVITGKTLKNSIP